MKKATLYLTIYALAIWMAGCRKDAATDFQKLDDAALASAIADDRDKQEIDPSTLPQPILQYATENHFDSYVDAAYFAEGKGYELVFASEERAFFNLSRRVLAHRLNDRNGPCGRWLSGRSFPVDSLRPAVVEYVHEHYPDRAILRAKWQGGHLLVLLRGHLILLFTENGVFEIDGQHWIDCRPCAPGSAADVPPSVVTQIQNRIPGGEIVRVCFRGDRVILGVSTPDGRHILVYDSSWNFLFALR